MARPVRFELTTPCSGGMYSIHLSYGRGLGKAASSAVSRLDRSYSISPHSLAPAAFLERLSSLQVEEPANQSRESEFPSPAFQFPRPSLAWLRKGPAPNRFFPLPLSTRWPTDTASRCFS